MKMNKTIKHVSTSDFKIPGGIHPHEFKQLSNKRNSEQLSPSSELTVVLSNSHDIQGELLVEKGQRISKGDLIVSTKDSQFGNNIHSPCDGEIMEINRLNLGHSSGLPIPGIRIKNNKNSSNEIESASNNYQAKWQDKTSEQLIERIHQAGIVGLGGAAFPTHIKIKSGQSKVDTLIVNAMECEPYITCDDRLIREKSLEILIGSLITSKAVGAKKILLGIEDNKPEAVEALSFSIQKLIDDSQIVQRDNLPEIKIVVVDTKYPSGGEKQLIQLLTGKEVPQKKYPAELGILVQNVATLYAIFNAVENATNLTERLVTITGDCVPQAGNYWIPFGTSVSHIINSLDIKIKEGDSIIFGGPLMGVSISTTNTPTQKSTNCIIFDSNLKTVNDFDSHHSACIRCGECEIACPVSLLPQQLYWFSQSEQWDELESQSLFDCIECGACSYVCPSEIPLVGYFRFAKSEIKHLNAKQVKSDKAKQRFENRENRLARIKAEREEKRRKTAEARKFAAKNKAEDPDGKQRAIKAALERVKQKKENQ